MMTTPKNALIVPSMFAGPDDHWYPDLRDRLTEAGLADIRTARIPEGEPELEAWMASIDDAAADLTIDELTVVVGHSLGAVAAAAYLTRHRDITAVGRFVNIAGFSAPLADAPFSVPFVEAADTNHIRTISGDRAVLVSSSDYGVPPAMTEAMAEEIDAALIRVENAGHFLAADGWTSAGPIGDLAAADL